MSANPLSLEPVLLGMNLSLYVVVRVGEGVLGLEFALERPGEPAVVSKCKELGDIPGGRFKRDRLFRESIALSNTIVQSLQNGITRTLSEKMNSNGSFLSSSAWLWIS